MDAACAPTAHINEGDTQADLDLSRFTIVDYAWVATALCVIIATALTIKLVWLHCRNFHRPHQQKHIVRILLMVPIYSIDSWLGFRFYWLSVYFDFFRDCYEAFVIYTFYTLLVEYCGGYERTKAWFEGQPPFKLVIPFCCITVAPKRGLLRWLSRLTLQYVVLRPPFALLSFFLQLGGRFCSGELTAFNAGYPYITFIMAVSVTIAMYALVLYYTFAKNELAPYRPVPKFLSVKFIIFMSFWQSVLIAGLVKIDVIKNTTLWSSDNISVGVQNTLICVEMLIVSVWHLTAFRVNEYASQGPKETSIWTSVAVCFNFSDVASDIYRSFFSLSRKDTNNGLVDGAEMKNVYPEREEISEVSSSDIVQASNSAVLV